MPRLYQIGLTALLTWSSTLAAGELPLVLSTVRHSNQASPADFASLVAAYSSKDRKKEERIVAGMKLALVENPDLQSVFSKSLVAEDLSDDNNLAAAIVAAHALRWYIKENDDSVTKILYQLVADQSIPRSLRLESMKTLLDARGGVEMLGALEAHVFGKPSLFKNELNLKEPVLADEIWDLFKSTVQPYHMTGLQYLEWNEHATTAFKEFLANKNSNLVAAFRAAGRFLSSLQFYSTDQELAANIFANLDGKDPAVKVLILRLIETAKSNGLLGRLGSIAVQALLRPHPTLTDPQQATIRDIVSLVCHEQESVLIKDGFSPIVRQSFSALIYEAPPQAKTAVLSKAEVRRHAELDVAFDQIFKIAVNDSECRSELLAAAKDPKVSDRIRLRIYERLAYLKLLPKTGDDPIWPDVSSSYSEFMKHQVSKNKGNARYLYQVWFLFAGREDRISFLESMTNKLPDVSDQLIFLKQAIHDIGMSKEALWSSFADALVKCLELPSAQAQEFEESFREIRFGLSPDVLLGEYPRFLPAAENSRPPSAPLATWQSWLDAYRNCAPKQSPTP